MNSRDFFKLVTMARRWRKDADAETEDVKEWMRKDDIATFLEEAIDAELERDWKIIEHRGMQV